jgi:hypothetical protein
MSVLVPIKSDAMAKIRKELPADAHIMQICFSTVAEGQAMNVDYTTFDQLGLAKPRRKSLLYKLGQVELLCDSFPKGGTIIAIGGLYRYPTKVVDGVAYAMGHLERGGVPLKVFPVPQRILDVRETGYTVFNIQLEAGGVKVMLEKNDTPGFYVTKFVGMKAPTPGLKKEFLGIDGNPKTGKTEEDWFGYCAEYEFFMGAIKKCRQWRECYGFEVYAALLTV